MSSLRKNVTLLLFVILSLAVETSSAFLFEDEPSLVSENIRLAALGGMNIMLEEHNNEINLYDFGELPAGVIDDDNGKSSIYILGRYGVDGVKELSSETDWFGGSLAIGGIYKYMERWAIGGSNMTARRDLGFYSVFEMTHERYDIRNCRDTVILALQVSKWLKLGVRGAYLREVIKKTEYINYWEGDDKTWIGEPSLSIALPGSNWSVGFGYTYTDIGDFSYDDNTRNFKLPIVYRGQILSLGLKVNHKRTYRHDGYMSGKETFGCVRCFCKVPIFDKTINIGLLVDREITYRYQESHDPIYNWFMDFGGGVALVDEDFGLIGAQLQHRIYHRYAPAYPKQTILNLGLELNPFKFIPVRIGYLFHSYDPEYPYSEQNIVTMGFGVYFLEKRAKIDFAYNLRKDMMKWYDLFSYDIYYDTQHIWGLSTRITF
jgi:hypothetical protein